MQGNKAPNVFRKAVVGRVRELSGGGASAKRLFNLHGIAGLGKTYAIRQIFFDQLRGTTAHPQRKIWLGFDPAEKKRAPADEQPFFSSFATAMGKLWAEFPVLGSLPRIPTDAENESTYFRTTPSTTTLGNNAITVLLLDGLDDLLHWPWLQEYVLKPLLDENQTLMVCTSQGRAFFHYWELREAVEYYELTTFDLSETGAYLQSRFSANQEIIWQATFQEYTAGYPLAVKSLADQLVRNEVQAEAQAVSVSAEDRDALRFLGVLRLLDLSVGRKLLEALNEPSQMLDIPLLVRLNRLRSQHMLLPSSAGYPEQFAPALRAELRERLLHEGRYGAVCAALAKIYHQRALERPKREPFNSIEWLYFSTAPYRTYGAFKPHIQLNEQVWLAEFQKLLEANQTALATAKEAEQLLRFVTGVSEFDKALSGLFYRDLELVQGLHELKLFDAVHARIQQHLRRLGEQPLKMPPDTKDSGAFAVLIPQLTLAGMLDSARGQTLRELCERLPVEIRPATMRDVQEFTSSLDDLVKQDNAFDANTFRRELVAMPPTSEIEALFRVLTSRGLILYDRNTRKYTAHQLIAKLNSQTEYSSVAASDLAQQGENS